MKIFKLLLFLLTATTYGINAMLSDDATKLMEQSLIQATQEHKKELVVLLLKEEVNINCTDEQGKTPLHHAVQKNNLEIVITLIIAGASVFALDQEGNSPLHFAAISNSKLEIIKVLLNEILKQNKNIFAYINITNFNGQTALDLAKLASYSDLSPYAIAGREFKEKLLFILSSYIK